VIPTAHVQVQIHTPGPQPDAATVTDLLELADRSASRRTKPRASRSTPRRRCQKGEHMNDPMRVRLVIDATINNPDQVIEQLVRKAVDGQGVDEAEQRHLYVGNPARAGIDLLTYQLPLRVLEERAQLLPPTPLVEELVAVAEQRQAEDPDFQVNVLDELVHDCASSPASDINNAGLEAQIAFLLEQLGEQHVRTELAKQAGAG
jgi:hypothetical protein